MGLGGDTEGDPGDGGGSPLDTPGEDSGAGRFGAPAELRERGLTRSPGLSAGSAAQPGEARAIAPW